ncbi:MAG: hypothetical protein WAL50_01950, partial [Kineosporiaceae bacterium]
TDRDRAVTDAAAAAQEAHAARRQLDEQTQATAAATARADTAERRAGRLEVDLTTTYEMPAHRPTRSALTSTTPAAAAATAAAQLTAAQAEITRLTPAD